VANVTEKPNQQPLFRREAIDYQRYQHDLGEITLLQPFSLKLLTWFLILVVVLIITFLYFSQFSRKQTVSGFLIPASGTMKIFAPREGVVTDLYVKEGQHVEVDQPLFIVTTAEVTADGEDINKIKLSSLLSHKEMLEKQIAAELRASQIEQSRLKALIFSLGTEINDIQGQLTTQQERIKIAEGLVVSVRELLAKGIMSAVEGQRRQDILLEQRQNLVTIQGRLTEKSNKLAETNNALEILPTETARKIQPLHDEIANIEQKRAETKGRSSYVVRASVSGTVGMLAIHKGQSVKPTPAQLEIIPENSPLRAELYVPTRAAGFIEVGQEVRLLYDAFPYQNFGAYQGRIIELSSTVVTKEGLSNQPVIPQEPSYKAIAILERPDVDAPTSANPERKMPLQAGMLLQARIILDRRSLAQWIINPLPDALGLDTTNSMKGSS
jgi:membrane fusion protein